MACRVALRPAKAWVQSGRFAVGKGPRSALRRRDYEYDYVLWLDTRVEGTTVVHRRLEGGTLVVQADEDAVDASRVRDLEKQVREFGAPAPKLWMSRFSRRPSSSHRQIAPLTLIKLTIR
jgi:hypothetical protein